MEMLFFFDKMYYYGMKNIIYLFYIVSAVFFNVNVNVRRLVEKKYILQFTVYIMHCIFFYQDLKTYLNFKKGYLPLHYWLNVKGVHACDCGMPTHYLQD